MLNKTRRQPGTTWEKICNCILSRAQWNLEVLIWNSPRKYWFVFTGQTLELDTGCKIWRRGLTTAAPCSDNLLYPSTFHKKGSAGVRKTSWNRLVKLEIHPTPVFSSSHGENKPQCFPFLSTPLRGFHHLPLPLNHPQLCKVKCKNTAGQSSEESDTRGPECSVIS